MSPLFSSSWARSWSGLHAKGDGAAVRDAVLGKYAEAHRRYHTTQHLAECLSLFESVQQAADRPHEVEMALWFHDAVYDLDAAGNEERSASWARAALIDAGVDRDAAARVHDLILVTRHTAEPVSRDERVLVDVDLSILGAQASRFAEYERQIREEYAYVPEYLFRLKRRAVLQSFIDRASIYGTPELHRTLEFRARENLAAAVAHAA